jgi:hypothetical protein
MPPPTGQVRSAQGAPRRFASPQGAGVTAPAKPKPKLDRLTVIRNATQKGVLNDSQPQSVSGDRNWATVRKEADKEGTEDAIVEATTIPNTVEAWAQIKWTGGHPVAGKPNQRRVSRTASKKSRVKAELGGVADHVDIWVLWAKVEILTHGMTPQNAAKFGGARDGTEKLGPVIYKFPLGWDTASGKIAAVATLSPKGVHDVVRSGWELKRKVWCHDWLDGNKQKPGNNRGDRWNTAWAEDTSLPDNLKLIPDDGDRIYDIDAPDLRFGAFDAEVYNNFRQWVEWNGELCSDEAGWYWQARWQNTGPPDQTPIGKVTLNDLGTGNKRLPDKSHFHPKGPAPSQP